MQSIKRRKGYIYLLSPIEEFSKKVLWKDIEYHKNGEILEERIYDESGKLNESTSNLYDKNNNLISNIYKDHKENTVQTTIFNHQDNLLESVLVSYGNDLYSKAEYLYDKLGRVTSCIEKTVDGDLILCSKYEYDSEGFYSIEKEYNEDMELIRTEYIKKDSFNEDKEITTVYHQTDVIIKSINTYLKEGHLLDHKQYNNENLIWHEKNEYDSLFEVTRKLINNKEEETLTETIYEIDPFSNIEKVTTIVNGETIEISETKDDPNGWAIEIKTVKKFDELHIQEEIFHYDNEYY